MYLELFKFLYKNLSISKDNNLKTPFYPLNKKSIFDFLCLSKEQ